MKNKNILEKVFKLRELFENGEIKRLHHHEVNPNLPKESRLNYLYFTLPVPINFQRNSQAMWASALKTYEDPETSYLFYPEYVAEKSREEVQKDLVKHKLALQRNKHTEIWYRLAETFHKFYENDPRNVLIESDHDVKKVLENIQIKNRKLFPYLSGTKMANYWLYILHHFTDVKLKNLQYISIIPDTHVLKCSVKLGLVQENSKPEEVSKAWFDLLENSDLMPIDMHYVLWNWSRAGFLPEV